MSPKLDLRKNPNPTGGFKEKFPSRSSSIISSRPKRDSIENFIFYDLFHLSLIPDPPSNLTATTVNATQVDVDWSASPTSTVDSYTLYVRNQSTGTIEQEITDLLGTSTTVFGLTTGDTYQFWVTAVDRLIESKPSNADTAIPQDITAPAAPTNLVINDTRGTEIDISWDANSEPDLAGYNVYYEIDGQGYSKHNGVLVVTESYTLTGLMSETTYNIKVTAVDTSGNESNDSNVVQTTTDDITAPNPPQNLTENAVGSNSVDISWDANVESDISIYRIYVDDVEHSNSPVSHPTTSFTVDGLIPETTYDIHVTAEDTSGNESGESNTITSTTTAEVVSSNKNISSLLFDGVDDYVEVPDDTALNFGSSNDFSISVWIKTDVDWGSRSDRGWILNKGDTDASYWMRFEDDNTIRFLLDYGLSADFVRSTDTYNDGQWHHVAVSVTRGGTMYLYIDGEEVDSTTIALSDIDNTFNLFIGSQDGSDHFEGNIDEFQLWNRALTRSEIVDYGNKILEGDETNLVGYWNAEDRNGGYSFDGSNDYIFQDNSSGDFNLGGGDWTVEAWFKTENYSGGNRTVFSGDYTENGDSIHIYAASGTLNFATRDSGNNFLSVSTPLPEDEWVHVAATRRGGVLYGYLNGTEIGSANDAISLTTCNNIEIGRRDGVSGFYWTGFIDEVRFWDVGRTQQEIQDNLNKKLQGDETNLVAYYPLDGSAEDKAASNDGTVNGATSVNILTDISSNYNHGVSNGAVYEYDGFDFDYSLSFDGIDDYVEVPSLSIGESVTGECWAKTNDTSNGYRAFSFANSDAWILLRLNSGGVANRVEALVGTTGGNIQVIYDGGTVTNYNHYAITASSNGSLRLYVNGILEASVGLNDPLSGSGGTVINTIGANRNPNGQFFNGVIDKVRLWTTERTQAEIQQSINKELEGTESGLLGLWKFDDLSNLGVAVDSTSNGNNDGTINGAVYSTDVVSYYQALSFDGIDDEVDLGDLSILQSTDFTIEFQFKLNTLSNDAVLITKGDQTQDVPLLIWFDTSVGAPADIGASNTNTISVIAYDGVTQHWVSAPTNTINDLDWHHVSVIINPSGNEIEIYVDGSLVVSNTKTFGFIQDTNIPIRFGNDVAGGANNPLDGYMDDVRFWNDVRTSQEISDNLNIQLQGNEANLVGYWTFNEAVGGILYDKASNNNGTINGATFTKKVGIK